MKGQKPTLLFRSGNIVGNHKIDLLDLFPLIFPYGWGVRMKKEVTELG